MFNVESLVGSSFVQTLLPLHTPRPPSSSLVPITDGEEREGQPSIDCTYFTQEPFKQFAGVFQRRLSPVCAFLVQPLTFTSLGIGFGIPASWIDTSWPSYQAVPVYFMGPSSSEGHCSLLFPPPPHFSCRPYVQCGFNGTLPTKNGPIGIFWPHLHPELSAHVIYLPFRFMCMCITHIAYSVGSSNIWVLWTNHQSISHDPDLRKCHHRLAVYQSGAKATFFFFSPSLGLIFLISVPIASALE